MHVFNIFHKSKSTRTANFFNKALRCYIQPNTLATFIDSWVVKCNLKVDMKTIIWFNFSPLTIFFNAYFFFNTDKAFSNVLFFNSAFL